MRSSLTCCAHEACVLTDFCANVKLGLSSSTMFALSRLWLSIFRDLAVKPMPARDFWSRSAIVCSRCRAVNFSIVPTPSSRTSGGCCKRTDRSCGFGFVEVQMPGQALIHSRDCLLFLLWVRLQSNCSYDPAAAKRGL